MEVMCGADEILGALPAELALRCVQLEEVHTRWASTAPGWGHAQIPKGSAVQVVAQWESLAVSRTTDKVTCYTDAACEKDDRRE